MERPFASAVGIETANQYRELSHTDFPRELGEIAVGLLMSEKTGLMGTPNRHGRIYPTFEATEEILHAAVCADTQRIPVIIHYNTDNPDLVGDQLLRALSPYPHIDGVQINGLREEHLSNLFKFKERRSDVSLIMQIDNELLSTKQPRDIVAMLTKYMGLIDYAWLDSSGGYGKLLNTRRLLPYIEALGEANIQPGVAGGLNADNLENQLLTLLEQYPEVSWDAQSGVQLRVEQMPRFDPEKAKDFLLASQRLRQTA